MIRYVILFLFPMLLYGQDSTKISTQIDTCVIINDVYLRIQPNIKSEAISTIKRSERILLLEGGEKYYKVKWNEYIGWVNKLFLNCPSHIEDSINAEVKGDFALSTYEWEWAPYWLRFKKKLDRVWRAPTEYTELGLIHGHTILRFRISKSGKIFDLEVLRQVGNSSLKQSSVDAINAVFPFLPLPENFPDEYLEVIVKMRYPNLREYSNQK